MSYDEIERCIEGDIQIDIVGLDPGTSNISKTHNVENTTNEMICLLTDLFNETIDASNKIQLLKDRYGLRTTDKFEKEVSSMTAYAARLLNEGMEKGIEKGIEKGQNMLIEAITRLRKGETPEQIIASGIDPETVSLAQTIK